MEIRIHATAAELNEALAQFICDLVHARLQEQPHFSLVLSGGSTPVALYKLLASDDWKHKVDWSRVLLFWGDERYVPLEDERNNAGVAMKTLLDHVPVRDEHVFRMRTDLEPQTAAGLYDQKLQELFGDKAVTFDLVLLGMGDDGHTLSLFPHNELLEDSTSWVRAAFIEKLDMYRLTLMPAVVNRAAHVVFMVSGAGKANMLEQVIAGEYDPKQLPSQLIQPSLGSLIWYVDEEAAKELTAR